MLTIPESPESKKVFFQKSKQPPEKVPQEKNEQPVFASVAETDTSKSGK
jgi:hypothetical protein